MGKRVTIVLDDSNNEKLRKIQSKEIKFSEKSVSFSKVMNEVIKKGLEQYGK